MKARLIDSGNVLKIVDLLRARGREVIAPFCGRGRDSYFDTVTDENRAQVRLHLPNPYYPPKRFVFPHIERLMRVHGKNGAMTIEPACEAPPRAIFGIRSCDVAGLWHLDRFYLGRDYRDVYYERRRKNLFLVNMVCTDPAQDIGNDCFCLCADTGPAAREHFDLQLMDLGDGQFMAVAGTAAKSFSPSRYSAREPARASNAGAPFWRRCANVLEPPRAGLPPPSAMFRRGRFWKRLGRKSATAAWNAVAALMSVRPAPVSPFPTARWGRRKSSACASGIPAA